MREADGRLWGRRWSLKKIWKWLEKLLNVKFQSKFPKVKNRWISKVSAVSIQLHFSAKKASFAGFLALKRPKTNLVCMLDVVSEGFERSISEFDKNDIFWMGIGRVNKA